MEVSNQLRFALGASALIASLSVAYYFVLFLPQKHEAEEARIKNEQVFENELKCQSEYNTLQKTFKNLIKVAYDAELNTCMVSYKDANGDVQTTKLAYVGDASNIPK
jgi:hypothetical protein